MRTEYFRIHEFYKILRDFYINRFPQRIPANIDMTAYYTTILIEDLNSKFMNAEIIPINGVYEITGSIVDAYKKSNPPKGSLAYLIAELSDKEKLRQFINNAVKDLEDLDFWLNMEGFTKNGVASEKLIKQTTWIE